MFKTKVLAVSSCAVLLLLVGVAFSDGAKLDSWVIDDFESYIDPNTLKATGLESGGPWWVLQDLEALLLGVTPPSDLVCRMCLTVGDPNGFTATGQVDADGPRAMQMHYELTSSAYSCDAFIFAGRLGLPFHIMPTGAPPEFGLPYLPCVDLTKFDRISLKMRKLAGNNSSSAGDFSVGFMGPDLGVIGQFSIPSQPVGPAFMEYPEETWQIIEFDLQGKLNTGGTTSQYGLDNVAGVAFGIYESPGQMPTKVTYIIDEIMVYKKSVPCYRYTMGDVNLDCEVNLPDLSLVAEDWLIL